jgi:hypothetical protein
MGEAAQILSETAYCRGCGRHKPLRLFYYRRKRRCHNAHCKSCISHQTRSRSHQDGIHRHYEIPPEASPERMAALALELGRLRERRIRCKACQRHFVAKTLAGATSVTGLLCPPCIDERVARVLAERTGACEGTDTAMPGKATA